MIGHVSSSRIGGPDQAGGAWVTATTAGSGHRVIPLQATMRCLFVSRAQGEMAADRLDRRFVVLRVVDAQRRQDFQSLMPMAASRLVLAQRTVRICEAVVRAGHIDRLGQVLREAERLAMAVQGCLRVAGRVLDAAQAGQRLELPVSIASLTGNLQQPREGDRRPLAAFQTPVQVTEKRQGRQFAGVMPDGAGHRQGLLEVIRGRLMVTPHSANLAEAEQRLKLTLTVASGSGEGEGLREVGHGGFE